MRLFRGLSNVPDNFTGCVASIGNFDGLHLGHQRILQELKRAAVEDGLPSLVILFEPQPKEFFAPQAAPARLANFREKFQDLKEAGIEYLLVLPFNQNLRSMSADGFIHDILINRLRIRHLIVGDDFRFGADRSGDFGLLRQAGEADGFTVERSQTFTVGDDRSSSTRVREELAQGQMVKAAELLGRPYSMRGRVAYGRQLGRTLDTPTANVLVKRLHLATTGVFAVQVTHVESGEEYNGVANLGVKPTVTETPEPSLEVHLFGFSGDIYGQHLHVKLLHKIRDEKKFNHIDELRDAIAADKQAAKIYFAARPDAFRF